MHNRLPLVISITALIVAVLGTTPLGQAAYNAVVPNNSVGNLQLKNGAVTETKLRGDAVTSGKVKNHSLKVIDFADGQIPAGPEGAKGDKGDKGDAGATSVVVRRVVFNVAGISGQASKTATCNEGERATGGGLSLADGGVVSTVTIRASRPQQINDGDTPKGWSVGFGYSATLTEPLAVFAICAKP